MSNRGVTIVELMASIVIISIVSTILYSSYQYSIKNSSEIILKIEAKNLLSDYLESEKLFFLDTTASELKLSKAFRGDSLRVNIVSTDSLTIASITFRDSLKIISISYPSLIQEESDEW